MGPCLVGNPDHTADGENLNCSLEVFIDSRDL